MQFVRSTPRRVAQLALKQFAAGCDRVRRPPRGAVVLIYHRVGALSPLEVDLPDALFDEQMHALAETGRAATLDDALRLVRRADADAPHALDPVVVTFDDGTADFVDHALPVLVKYQIPSLLYVATDFVTSGRSFPNDGTPVSWAALRDATSTGLVDIGSHTHTHALLDRLAPEAVAAELDVSKDQIEHEIGQPARHFAYPKALEGSEAARAAVRARFASAALAGTRSNSYGACDPYRLWRSPVQRADGMRWFDHKLAGGMRVEDDIRQVANRLRYRGATS